VRPQTLRKQARSPTTHVPWLLDCNMSGEDHDDAAGLVEQIFQLLVQGAASGYFDDMW
jgi:hypothetical protein